MQEAQAFDVADVDTMLVLGEWAAVAINSARLFGEVTTRGRELERALRTMRTAMEIATAIGADTDLSHILELIVERARTLVDADGLLIWLRHGDQLRIAAVAGNADVPDQADNSARRVDSRRGAAHPPVGPRGGRPADVDQPG